MTVSHSGFHRRHGTLKSGESQKRTKKEQESRWQPKCIHCSNRHAKRWAFWNNGPKPIFLFRFPFLANRSTRSGTLWTKNGIRPQVHNQGFSFQESRWPKNESPAAIGKVRHRAHSGMYPVLFRGTRNAGLSFWASTG
jgi:hypothetical protein